MKMSPMERVIEGVKVFGPPSVTFASTHWKKVCARYERELDELYWVKTGKHLPRKTAEPRPTGLVLPPIRPARKSRTSVQLNKEMFERMLEL